MTGAIEPAMTIAQSTQAGQEPRRIRQLRRLLQAEGQGAVCANCGYQVSAQDMAIRNYRFNPNGRIVHPDCAIQLHRAG